MVWVFKFDVDDDGTYEVTLSGAVIVSTMEELNGYEDVRFTIPNTTTNRGYISVDVDFQILWDVTSIYEGVCTGGNYTPGLLMCFGYNKVFEAMQKKTHTGTYTAAGADVILAAICASAGVTDSFIAAGFPGGIAPTLGVRFDEANCFDAAVYIARACIGDYYTTLGTTFNIIKTRGAAAVPMTTISVSRRGIDRAKQRDLVVVIGVDAAGNRIEGSFGVGTDKIVFREKKASDVATLQALAEDYHNQLNKESSGASISVPVTDGYNIHPGDEVTINNALYALAGDYRVWKITKNIGLVSLEVDKSELNIDRVIDEMRDLEDLGIYVISITNIPPSVQPWNSDLTFYPFNPPGAGDEHNCARWGAPWPNAGNVHFSDGTDQEVLAGDSKTIFGSPLVDGSTYYFYFTIGDNTMNITTNYQTATDVGNGILAVVRVSPDVIQNLSIQTYKSGGRNVIVDELGDQAVDNRVITAGSIYGKDIATQANVGEVLGSDGIRILGDDSRAVNAPTGIGDAIGGNFTAGIWGFAPGPARTFWLDPATGKIWVYGTGMFGLRTYPGNDIVGYFDATIRDLGLGAGNQDMVLFRDSGAGAQLVGLQSQGRAMYLDGANNRVIFADAWDYIGPLTDGGVDLGTPAIKFGDIWGKVHYSDIHMSDTHCETCGIAFEQHDSVKYTVKDFRFYDSGLTEIVCVPVHDRCPVWKRLVRWLNGLRLGD